MVALGLLLVLIGGGMFGGVAYSMVASLPIVVFSQSLGTFPQWVFFLFGMGAGAVALLGVQLILGGLAHGARRSVRRRAENRRQRRAAVTAQPYPPGTRPGAGETGASGAGGAGTPGTLAADAENPAGGRPARRSRLRR